MHTHVAINVKNIGNIGIGRLALAAATCPIFRWKSEMVGWIGGCRGACWLVDSALVEGKNKIGHKPRIAGKSVVG